MSSTMVVLNWVVIAASMAFGLCLWFARRNVPQLAARHNWLILAYLVSSGLSGLLRASRPGLASGIQIAGFVALVVALPLMWIAIRSEMRRVGLIDEPGSKGQRRS